MWDIYWGLAVSLALSVMLFLTARAVGKRLSSRLSTLLVCALLLLIIVYIRDIWNTRWIASLLPFSNLIVLGNWLPQATAILSGLSWHVLPSQAYRRPVYAGLLLLLSLYAQCHPLWGNVPECRDEWSQDVCLQTTEQTCSPAAAATLLRAYGIDTTEQEMARLCLTRAPVQMLGGVFSHSGGTYWQGLYRGLVLKTEASSWRVEAFGEITLGELHQILDDGPAILTVGLPITLRHSLYEEEWGWVPGVSHSAVVFRVEPGQQLRMGEPSFGAENWTEADLLTLWKGEGIRLVRR